MTEMTPGEVDALIAALLRIKARGELTPDMERLLAALLRTDETSTVRIESGLRLVPE